MRFIARADSNYNIDGARIIDEETGDEVGWLEVTGRGTGSQSMGQILEVCLHLNKGSLQAAIDNFGYYREETGS
jgi:hypothetical protein